MAEKRKDHSLGGSDVELKKKRRRVVDAFEIEEEAFLEEEMVKKYRSGGEGLRTFSGNYRTGDVSMFAYRMYLLNHRRSDSLGNTVSLRSRTITKPRVRTQPLQTVDIDRCWGRLDFGFECDKSYVLSASRRIPSSARRSDALHTYYCDNFSSLVSSPHCEFLRPNHTNDFVWIKDLNSEHGTFVNGKKITPMTNYKLVDGDIVGLGISHNSTNPQVNVTSREYYIMKVKTLVKPPEEEQQSVSSIVNTDNAGNAHHDPMGFALNIVLIVDKILKYLKLKDLKNCRLLNGFWKSRTDMRMVSLTHLKFEFTYHPRHLSLSEVKWSDSFQEKVALIKKYKISSFEIDVTNNSPVGTPRQFYSDIQWLLDNMGHVFKDLILSMSVIHDRDGSGFKRIFSQLVNVETLDLSIDINTSFYPNMGSALCLPSVKRLALWVHDVEGDDEMRDPLKNHIIAEIAKLFPNLHGINVKTGLLQNFLRYLQTNRETWKNLTEISAEFELYGDSEDPIVSFTTIKTLPQTLHKLQLDDIPALTALGVTAFEQMLKKHSATLEFLCLKFAESGTEDAQIVLNLPSFPRLTSFEIIIYVDDEDLYLKLRFPSGHVSYEKDFPKIRYLSLLPGDSISDDESDGGTNPSNVEEILTTFLPEESSTVCSTMRWVDFNLDKDILKKDHQSHQWYRNFLCRFQKIFPHVHHPEVIRGLQSFKAD